MALVNMQMSPDEAKREYGESLVSDAPKYPYELQIRLDDESLEKLGMHALPQVGQTLMITERVQVQSVSERKDMGGNSDRDVCLQITDMELGADKKETDIGASLYGG